MTKPSRFDALKARADSGNLLAVDRLAAVLTDQGRTEEALTLLLTHAGAGDRAIAAQLAWLLSERRDIDALKSQADARNEFAAWHLSRILVELGRLDEGLAALRTVTDGAESRVESAFVELCAEELYELLAEHGHIEELRARADAGSDSAAARLAELLSEQRDTAQLAARAADGDRHCANELARLLAAQGRIDDAHQVMRAAADAGDHYLALRLASSLAAHGRTDELTTRAEAGDRFATGELATRLAAEGRIEEAILRLRSAAANGDSSATSHLVQLLTEHGKIPELHELAAAGDDDDALEALVALLTKQDRLEEAHALLVTSVAAGHSLAAFLLDDIRVRSGRIQELRLLAPDETLLASSGAGSGEVRLLSSNRLLDLTCVRLLPEAELLDHEARCVERERQGSQASHSVDARTDWETVMESVRRRTEAAYDCTALVSLVFCHPESIVLKDLMSAHAYLDLRCGVSWDLHFVGYSSPAGNWLSRPKLGGIALWRFRPSAFDEIRRAVNVAHTRALAEGPAPFPTSPWRFSGRPELVSFMAYRDHPGCVDWLSLRSVPLTDANGSYLHQSLAEVVETMSDWRDSDSAELRELAPGQPPAVQSVLPLQTILEAMAVAVASGVVGNAAYDLIKRIAGL